MRAVVDNNIFVRATIKPRGTVGPILRLLAEGAYTLVYSDELVTELRDVLGRSRVRRYLGSLGVSEFPTIALILQHGIRVTPDRRIAACRDPDDDRVLEVAVAAHADVIVSGDQDLLVLNPFEGIPIVGPSAFLRMLNEE